MRKLVRIVSEAKSEYIGNMEIYTANSKKYEDTIVSVLQIIIITITTFIKVASVKSYENLIQGETSFRFCCSRCHGTCSSPCHHKLLILNSHTGHFNRFLCNNQRTLNPYGIFVTPLSVVIIVIYDSNGNSTVLKKLRQVQYC
jgi:hypothetical protein